MGAEIFMFLYYEFASGPGVIYKTPVVYATDSSKAEDLVSFLPYVVLWFLIRPLHYLCFHVLVLFDIVFTSHGKE